MGRFVRCVQSVIILAGWLMAVAGVSPAQDNSPTIDPSIPDASVLGFGIPEDWSTQRVIYTRNGSVEDMMKVRSDPRFLNSYLLHAMRERLSRNNNLGLQPSGLDQPNSSQNENFRQSDSDLSIAQPPRRTLKPRVDWAVSLGGSFGMAIGESPAKFVFNPSATPTCSDFVVFSLKAAPAVGGQANLVALQNLYSGTPAGICGSLPTFLFAYAIGSGGSLLSPVLSLDGKKVAWIENTSANHAILHVTTWVSGQGTDATHSVAVGSGSSDVAIDYTSAANTTCPTSVNINTNSEIYVDYQSDSAFVGADNGVLYHLKSLFKTPPAFDFCITVNSGAGTALSGGVYDSLLNPPEFFIADSKKLYAYTVGASSFTLKASVTYGTGTLTGPGPILDAFNNFIYVFSASDTGTPAHTSVSQFPTSLGAPVVVPLGPASTNAYPILFYGAFDNSYLTLGPKNSKSTLYSCGTDSTTTTAQDLFAISFNPSTGLANITPAMSANKNVNPGGKNGTCSPITEFFDGTTDRIFVGMGQHTANTGANVVQMWNVTNQLTNAATTPTASAMNYIGGPSGMVIDNNASSSTFPQAESVYFTTLVCNGAATCGTNQCCAVKLTQSLLK